MRALRLTIIGITALLALWLAPAASAYCTHLYGDPGPGYSGPVYLTYSCDSEAAANEPWTAPDDVTSAQFRLVGADDPAEGRGGYLLAAMPVVPGETLELSIGGNGEASTVSRDGTPLLVAGGGDGVVPNQVAPDAVVEEILEPGRPLTEAAVSGHVSVSWQTGWVEVTEGRGELFPGLNRPRPAAATPNVDSGCTVPKLRGKRLPAARRLLAAAGCVVGQVARRSSARKHHRRVLIQSAAPGSTLAAQTEVDLVVGGRA